MSMVGHTGNIVRLLAQIDEQKERIRQLEGALGFHLQAPLELSLTPAQSSLFGCIYARPIAGKEALQMAHDAAAGCNSNSDPKTIDVMICHMRKKLRPHGIEIKTVWGQGYRMPDESKQRVREMFAEESAQQAALTAVLMEHSNGKQGARHRAL